MFIFIPIGTTNEALTKTRSGRIIKQPNRAYHTSEMSKTKIIHGLLVKTDMSIKEALNGDRPEEAKKAILNEIQNMLEYKVGYYVNYDMIPKDKRKNILRAFMFIKEKYKPNGIHDKTKARMVGDGSKQNQNTYDIISSTTVDISCVFLLLCMASYLSCDITCYDIRGAFLNARFTEEDEVIYLKVSKDIVEFWKIVDPSVKSHIDDYGNLYLKLEKFIYGLKQSPAKFQDHLRETLVATGYTPLVNDNCIYIKKDDFNISILSTHVDDILQVCNNQQWKMELHQTLVRVYNTIEMQDPGCAYLGMDIRRGLDLKDIYVSQPKLTEDIIKQYLGNTPVSTTTPSRIDIVDIQDEDTYESGYIDKSEYLSMIMKLMYLARLTRPDILYTVTYLATKSQNPTKRDWMNGLRVIKYLNGTRTHGIHINCIDLNTYAHCDASYASHPDGRGHSGYIFSIGKSFSYVHAKSGKQKVGTASSTDAEIVAAKECCKMIAWIRNVIRELDLETTKPTILFQDNKSSIVIYTTDKPKYSRVKHILTSISYIRSMIEHNELCIKYLPTTNMTADMLTKSLGTRLHVEHANNCGVKDLHELI
jgi:hypothetical protein